MFDNLTIIYPFLPKPGEVVVKLHPEWAPIGVERIQDLTTDSFWEGCRAFRVLPNFVVQLGINGDPAKQKKWKKNLEDDPVKTSNTRGTVTFAMAGRGTRTTQIFFNKVDNSRLDPENFAPFGEVIRCVTYIIVIIIVSTSFISHCVFLLVQWNGYN